MDENIIESLAFDLVANTLQSVFLTGKAGTGKTTFLRRIQEKVYKNKAITAPTGIAAINAGGVTLHSFLQLPFEPFTPDYEGRKKMDYHFKMRKSKIELIQSLELLVIDEVSMLRADMLDAIDYVLKRYRNTNKPFGGVQMLFIGDLFQLPPVVQPKEWTILEQFYSSPFFFDAHALRDNLPVCIELTKVYRQQDKRFIELLNRVRNNCVRQQDLDLLNARMNLSSQNNLKNPVILTTHNYQADQINKQEMDKLPGKLHTYLATVEGDFSENAFPTEYELSLKEGAQIMFVKNDVGEYRRYYNGKLGEVVKLTDNKISIAFREGGSIDLERDTWKNIRYKLNEASNDIEEEELGQFSQFPIRLAWAITIHKSQGLTFDHVQIDAGRAFAEGQVYVALSRCTSLEGIILKSRISPQAIRTSEAALHFENCIQTESQLNAILIEHKPQYTAKKLKQQFDWKPLLNSLVALKKLAEEKRIPDQEKVIDMFSRFIDKAIAQEDVAKKFIMQLDAVLATNDVVLLKHRVQKAAVYFVTDVQGGILTELKQYKDALTNMSKIKQYKTSFYQLYDNVEEFVSRLKCIYYGNLELTEGVEFPESVSVNKDISVSVKEKALKSEKIPKERTRDISLSLFKEGKTVEEIALERNIGVATVQDHLIQFIPEGDILPQQLIAQETIDYLMPRLQEYVNFQTLSEIKNALPDKYTYLDIKVVMTYLRSLG